MIKRGYPKGYAASVVCLTSLITATIPPSLGLILYGFIGEVSIGRLFAAGIIPGLMMMAILMLTVSITANRRGFDIPPADTPGPTFREIMHDLKDSIWALLFPVLLIVGIRFGLFTPSEAGAFAVVYALCIGRFVYKELTWRGFKLALRDSFIDNGGIILIIALSGIFGYALTMENVPQRLAGGLTDITRNPQMMLLLIVGFLLIAGLFVDSNVNVLLLTPIFLPALQKVGVDPVHFGVVMMTIVTMGVMTPPVGTACYIVCDILACPIEQFVVESLSFFAAVVTLVIILIFFPQAVLWVPNLIYG
jgi:tripartite ATP-independent transporter DctM subunit